MKYSKRYLAFCVILVIALLVKFNALTGQYVEIGSFRGAHLTEEVWNPLIAGSVNDNLLSVMIDNKEYTNEDYPFYMDDNLNIMVPVTVLRDALNCSAHVYDDEKLLVEKHSKVIEFPLDQTVIDVNGEVGNVVSPFTQKDDRYYVSLNDLSGYLDYSYSWNIQENTATAVDNSGNAVSIPTRYDLRQKGRVPDVRNQGAFGTCWAFAALGAMESSLLPEEEVQYSPDHMTLGNGFNLTQADGGEYTMGMAYLAAWRGPVYEEDDPYGDNETDDTLTAVKHVQEMQVIDGKDYERIKEAVFKYGGVQTSIYNALRSSTSQSPYYNRETSSYCYIGTEKPNHDVVIVGWDDSYSKENFSVDLEGDGAFICQNSWGEEFGDQGFFYVSYYDTNIGTHNVAYTRIDETDNYDHIYQSDLCGWVGQLGYNRDSIYGANVFTTGQEEQLVAAGFYATGKDSEYEIYLVRNFENEESFSQMIPIASGKLGNAGYYTVDFNQGVALDAGERYAIVLHMITPGSVHPMAIEYAADDATKDVILDDGESYISLNGTKWVSVDTVEQSNLCIKGFSVNR
ncbi:MAG: cell surface protein [Roseburia sp.]|nr:cell surface protein [Roseburia sp.]MBD5556967.1 cell surface protein [Roseburia sp.]